MCRVDGQKPLCPTKTCIEFHLFIKLAANLYLIYKIWLVILYTDTIREEYVSEAKYVYSPSHPWDFIQDGTSHKIIVYKW